MSERVLRARTPTSSRFTERAPRHDDATLAPREIGKPSDKKEPLFLSLFLFLFFFSYLIIPRQGATVRRSPLANVYSRDRKIEIEIEGERDGNMEMEPVGRSTEPVARRATGQFGKEHRPEEKMGATSDREKERERERERETARRADGTRGEKSRGGREEVRDPGRRRGRERNVQHIECVMYAPVSGGAGASTPASTRAHARVFIVILLQSVFTRYSRVFPHRR